MNNERRKAPSLNSDSIRRRLATAPPERRSDIGHIWRNQKRVAPEKWELAPDESPLLAELKEIISKSFVKIRKSTLLRNLLQKALYYKHALRSQIARQPKKYVAIALGAFLITPLALAMINQNHHHEQKDTLGASTDTSSLPEDGATDEKPVFSILYPSGKQNLEAVTRKTPSGELIHTYRDTIDSVEIEVTEQALPSSFKDTQASELEKMAKNFQATNVIQIDEMKVFHGLNEKTQVQSLFTIKNQVLISIRSSAKLSDDTWAGYILGLQ